jgi:hypothetical protein
LLESPRKAHVQVQVEQVAAGAVTKIKVINGGSFTGMLPTTLNFVNEVAVNGTAAGFTGTPCWRKRYSQTYSLAGRAYVLSGISSAFNLVTNNHFTNHAGSAGVYTQPVGILFINYPPSDVPHHWLVA